MNWQLIESCPDDDTPRLIYDGYIICTAAKWECLNIWHWGLHGASGIDAEPDFGKPTHWMPLPDPPLKDKI